MGGRLFVESALGEGSTFVVVIDLAYSNFIDLLADEQVHTDNIRFEGARLLLVEDNEMNQFIFTELLKNRGMHIDQVENGLAAVQKVATGHVYDLILMDIHMPGLNGYDAARKIRALHCDTPIIAITADAIKGVNQKVLDSGMNGYISKPIDPFEMMTTIKDAIGNSKKYTKRKQVLELEDNRCQEDGKDGMNLTENHLLEQFPGLEINEGLLRLDGSDHIYIKILKIFKDRQFNSVQDIKNAMAKDDLASAILIAHTLKGVSASVGANEVAKVAGRVQNILEGRDSDLNMELVLKELEKKLEITHHSIDKYLKIYDKQDKENDSDSTFDPGKNLLLLENMITKKDTEVLELFDEMDERLCGFYGKKNIENLRYALLSFHWKEAKEMVDELKKLPHEN
jgi:two-component system, sensor histidine kinase and response regulator